MKAERHKHLTFRTSAKVMKQGKGATRLHRTHLSRRLEPPWDEEDEYEREVRVRGLWTGHGCHFVSGRETLSPGPKGVKIDA